MNIPGDTGHPWRLRKFVEYQHAVPPIGPATYLEWAKVWKYSPDECVKLAWFNSLSYCELTALFLLHRLPLGTDYAEFWRRNKSRLIFASARMYVKNMDWFFPLMDKFSEVVCANGPYGWLSMLVGREGDPQRAYQIVYKELMRWPYMGRFSVELFTDAIVQMSREGLLGPSLRFEADTLEWKKGASVTSGLLNIFYQDDAADIFDKTGKLEDRYIVFLDRAIVKVAEEIERRHPEQDTSISVITPKLCSWRNLFKGRRYGGFHHDRQLEQLRHYQEAYPKDPLWKRVENLRRRIFVPELLGEVGGWDGIRKERKRLWLDRGLTGIEEESR